jgi:hypothetical protein
VKESQQILVHEESDAYPGEIYEILLDKIDSGPADYFDR